MPWRLFAFAEAQSWSHDKVAVCHVSGLSPSRHDNPPTQQCFELSAFRITHNAENLLMKHDRDSSANKFKIRPQTNHLTKKITRLVYVNLCKKDIIFLQTPYNDMRVSLPAIVGNKHYFETCDMFMHMHTGSQKVDKVHVHLSPFRLACLRLFPTSTRKCASAQLPIWCRLTEQDKKKPKQIKKSTKIVVVLTLDIFKRPQFDPMDFSSRVNIS